MKTFGIVSFAGIVLTVLLLTLNIDIAIADVSQDRTCGTMEYHEYLMQTDPIYAQNQLEIERFTNQYILDPSVWATFEKRQVIVIPVVVHVVYHTTAQNVSDAQIQSQIDVINEDYRKLNADVSNVPAEFVPFVTDAKIQFQLAVRDPNCNATNGITRTYTSVTEFTTTSNAMKYTSTGGHDAWPRDQYLNLWVCHLA
ncbi:MAG: hypothetical protein AB1746_15715, partial [Candidatus Zixiibacteriota bacterium]